MAILVEFADDAVKEGADRVAAMAPGLEGHEFVAHVFVTATGPHARDAYSWIVGLWDALGPVFGIGHPLGRRPDEPPAAIPSAEGVVAVRTGTGSGRQEAVLRRVHDVISLTVLRAPAPGPRWDTLDAEWSALFTPPATGLIGSARILQARLDDPAQSLDAATLGPVVQWENHVAGEWWRRGVERPEPPLGPFAVWEASDAPGGQVARDGRADRRIIVVALHDRDAQLSAWTWTHGEDLTPFARYLMHAAKMRYELRLWATDTSRPDLRVDTERAIAPLLTLAQDVADAGREPDADALLVASLPLGPAAGQ